MVQEKEVVCETTVCDGSTDIVTVIMHDVQSDIASIVTKYGKYAVYLAAGLIGFRLFKLWRHSRRR